MGCGHNSKKISIEKIIKDKLYEDYEEINPYTYVISFYNLTWKKKPNICIFQKISEEVVKKPEINSLNLILEKTEINSNDKMNYLMSRNQILFYIFCNNGVIITRNYHKINYYIYNYIDNIIKISFVDFSLIILPEKEYFSLYELKRQSKYYFNLNMKEIDFTKRNELTNDGKLEQLSDFEDIEDEVEKEEKDEKINNDNNINIKINVNHFNGQYIINEDDNFLGIKDMNKRKSISNGNILLDVNSILNKNKNNKLLKEIKEHGNKNKSKEKNSDKNKNKIDKKDKKDKNNKNKKSISLDKNNKKFILKKFGNINLNTNDNISKSKEKTDRSKHIKNSNSKDILFKNDKLLFKNKKELNKNIKIYKSPKQIPTMMNGTNEEMYDKLYYKNGQKISREGDNLISLLSNKNLIKGEKKNLDKSYEIKDKCLIISTNNFTKELNSELQKILFIQDNNQNSFEDNNDINFNKKSSPSADSCFDHINFYYEGAKKRLKHRNTQIFLDNVKIEKNNGNRKNNRRNSIVQYKEDIEDYIIIFNRHKIPFDKKISSHNINKIYFHDCNFNLVSIYYLKEFISMLVKYEDLKKVYFSNNDIDMNYIGWKFLKQLFRENYNIRWVSFKNSNLNDNIFESIMSSLLLKRIKYLNFSNNNLTNKSMYLLNTFLIKNQTIFILDLSKNKSINKDGIKLILNSLKFHPNINKIDLSYMNLIGIGEAVSNLLSQSKSIHTLILRNDKLNNKDMEFISKELIKRDSILKNLDLSENVDIGDDGLKEIGKIIYNNISLKSIGLDEMNLSINNYLPIFNGIYKNKIIEYYSISKNGGLPLKGVLNFFQKNPQVKKLNIIPWDIENKNNDDNQDEEENKENKFTEEEIFLLEKFHLKAPHVILVGINFIDN